jgi:protein TonB
MRIYAALLPATLLTLALFCLMQYLISGSRMPVALPDYHGFVNLIHLQRDPVPQDSPPPGQALSGQPRVPEDTLPLPQPVAAAAETPDFPELSFAMPGLAPLDLDHGPYLARPGEHAVTQRAHVEPDTRTALKNIDKPAMDMPASNTASAHTPATPGITGLTGELAGIGSDEVIPLFRIDPDYPRKAARARKEGWVKIEFTISEHGTVIDPVVVEARPRRTFNRSALTAIRKWQFKPKLSDGKPVSRRASQVIEFNLANR